MLDAASTSTRIAAPEGCGIELEAAAVRARGAAGVELSTPKSLEVRSEELQVTAGRGRAFFTEATHAGESVSVRAGALERIADSCERTAGRLVERARRRFRSVRGDDVLDAGRIDIAAREDAMLHGSEACVAGEKLLKLDAKQFYFQ